ncbi:serine protease SP24D-like [Culex pipiens pallens]|uniref:serine protease SP24D-like n=1 Tax=Culex pipiens pallens TaxID=42434 RepID=UPI00195396E7|nr:serine protease SP24D-like [Culex pipiens pallens]
MKKFAIVCLFLGTLVGPSFARRIFGGQFAEDRQFPYQVALFHNGHFDCGGSIIDNRWILTAAHCVLELNGSVAANLSVLVGSQHLVEGGRRFEPEAIFAHESYGDFQNDIALIKLGESIEYDELSQPIALYEGDDLPKDSVVVISGHGRTEDRDFSELLKFNRMLVDTQESCGKDREGLICFNEKVGNGACHGDSGGPAVFEGRQVGVANFVQGSCGTKYADGYAKVTHYREWIDRTKRN